MFHFKQFSIEDEGATMKVGTDALLLGAMAEPAIAPKSILDIGTGCGILALMMAQRFHESVIDAIDIDIQTSAVANTNFQNSPWSGRMKAIHISLQEYAEHCRDNGKAKYDLILSNPPYFSNSLRNTNPRKRLARHDDTLPIETLFTLSRQMLSPIGTLSVIIPSSGILRAVTASQSAMLSLASVSNICNRPNDPPKLAIMQFSNSADCEPQVKTYYLRDSDNSYSQWYNQMAGPYLAHLNQN